MENSSHPSSDSEPVRLQKYLAACGVGSRRFCETLITAGRVQVDGHTMSELGSKVLPGQRVCVDGKSVDVETFRYYLVDKPRGILCTSHDPQGRETIIQWAQQMGIGGGQRLYTVGRLDQNSEGLILLTNDGAFAQAMAHPKHHVQKEYLVWPSRNFTDDDIRAFREGVEDDGELLKALSVSPTGEQGGRPGPVHIILGEGKNRHIRRMLAVRDIKTRRLRRIRIGFMTDRSMKKAPFRELSAQDIQRLLGPQA